jgi:hypothetical protein
MAQFPPELIYEIGKYCHWRTILAITKTCKKFISKEIEEVDLDVIPKPIHKKRTNFVGEDDVVCKLKRNNMWKLAMETQFHTKKYLPFFGDIENYFLAKVKTLAIYLNINQEDYVGLFEYGSSLDRIDEANSNYCGDSGYFNFIKFYDIKDRFIIVNIDNEISAWSNTYSNAYEMAIKLGEDDGGNYCKYAIIDLKYSPINFWNSVIKNRSYQYYDKYINADDL